MRPLGTSFEMAEMFRRCFPTGSSLGRLLVAENGGQEEHFDRLLNGSFGEIDTSFSGIVPADSGNPIAMAVITRREHYLWYAWLMVEPHHRNLGIGSRLLLNPLADGGELRLCVDANSRQHRFYERLGFSLFGVEYTKYLMPRWGDYVFNGVTPLDEEHDDRAWKAVSSAGEDGSRNL